MKCEPDLFGRTMDWLTPKMVLLALAAQGPGSNDERRLAELLRDQQVRNFHFHRSTRRLKLRSALRLLIELFTTRYDLIVIEGTGLLSAAPILAARLIGGRRYLLSTGDAVGPFVAAQMPALGPLFSIYERAIYRFSTGVIAWTPYLAGRAMTLGAPRTITVPGWAPYPLVNDDAAHARQSVRAALRIPPDSLVVGIVGSLKWNRRYAYCYGAELIRAVALMKRQDVIVLVVGGGAGLEHLRDESRGSPCVRFTGSVPQDEVSRYLAAMDLASLPQSLDKVGSFRYSTKLPEYLAARLPIVTGQLPVAYDLCLGAFFRLPGREPWSDVYIQALAQFLENLRPADLPVAAESAAALSDIFDPNEQRRRVSEFIADILNEA